MHNILPLFVLSFVPALNAWTSPCPQADKQLDVAHDIYANQYDYHQAIPAFKKALDLYADCKSTAHDAVINQAAAHVGKAMSHHNIGQVRERNDHMTHAQRLLDIPTEPQQATRRKVSPAEQRVLADYWIADGYRTWTDFEQLAKLGKPYSDQEACLGRMRERFVCAQEYVHNNHTPMAIQSAAVAVHGLGTVAEFMSKLKLAQGDAQLGRAYQQEAVQRFEHALRMRTQLHGSHPHVARSAHKLARNIALLADMDAEQADSLRTIARTYYQQALDMYTNMGIPSTQSKRHELEQDYRVFMERHFSHTSTDK